MPYAPVNGVQLYYETHGEGPAIAFCHGANGNHTSWWPQIPFLMNRYRCITYDQRGFGFSRLQPGQPGGNAFVDDLEGLLDHLEVRDVRVVGFSMGGRTALGYTVRRPDKSKALILADTTAGFVTEGMAKRLQEIQRQREASSDPIALVVGPDFPRREPGLTFLLRQVAGLNPPRDADFMTRGPASPPPTVDQLRAMKVPTLLIVGDQDAGSPPELMREVQNHIPGSRLETVQGSGHSTYFEKPAVFNKLLSDFLASVDGR